MNVKEASKAWDITEETILKYISKGYIDCLSCNGNEVILPHIPKPYSCKKGDKLDDDKRMLAILKACNKNQYISAYMLDITPEHFEYLIDALVKGKYLAGSSECGASNVGYHIAENGFNIGKKSFKINLNINFNNTNKIGLINL